MAEAVARPALRRTGDCALSDDGAGPVYLAKLPDGPIVVLEGAGALIFRELTSASDERWLGRVAAAVGQHEADVAPAVEEFVADLRARGLVE